MLFMLLFACLNNQASATESALEYVEQMYPDSIHRVAICENFDSDGDRRVRCNVSLELNNDHIVDHIDCPGALSWASVCVKPKVRNY